MSKPLASLIISAYSNDQYLGLVLNSLLYQTDKRFEIIVSEDAEHPHMKDFLQKLNFPIPLRHITQPDTGWNKNKALNRAIEAAGTDYLVFIDEDCLLHPRFMEFHIKLADKNSVLAGKRIKLDPQTTQLIIHGQLTIREINGFVLKNFYKLRKQGARFVEEGLFINPKSVFGFIPALRTMYQLKGCNMSFSRKAIYDINGFDEDYTRPAIGEDIDLTWRFQRAGYKLKSLRNLAVQYHLYHKENWTNQVENIKLMQQKQALDQFICLNGIKKLL